MCIRGRDRSLESDVVYVSYAARILWFLFIYYYYFFRVHMMDCFVLFVCIELGDMYICDQLSNCVKYLRGVNIFQILS